MQDFLQRFVNDLRHTSALEYIAVITGIASVWFSKKENILVYPVGLVNTTVYIYLSARIYLYGEATVNLYYTIASIYGWIVWSKKDVRRQHVLLITNSTGKERLQQLLFFTFFYVTIFFSLTYLKDVFYANTIPWADAFASASAFTGMWLMTRKKVESWVWWIATNIASVPLYFIKHLALTSVYYFILLILAIAGLIEWKRKAIAKNRTPPQLQPAGE